MLSFDESAHTYFWDGVAVPNVTRVIAHLTSYDHIPPAVLAKAQAEGKAVHKMVELHCHGILGAIPDWMESHREAWKLFLSETGFEPVLCEHKVYHPTMRCAGTLDLFGEFKNLKGAKGAALIDVKRSFYGGAAIGLQLAGYDVLLRADKAMPRVENRFALRLGGNGKYTLKPYEDCDDEAAFLACLQQFRWRQKYYPVKEG